MGSRVIEGLRCMWLELSLFFQVQFSTRVLGPRLEVTFLLSFRQKGCYYSITFAFPELTACKV